MRSENTGERRCLDFKPVITTVKIATTPDIICSIVAVVNKHQSTLSSFEARADHSNFIDPIRTVGCL